MFIRNEKNGICFYTSSLLSEYNISHGFFTRHGGVSDGDFDSLNVSTARKDRNGNCDNQKNVYENYRLSLSVLGTSPENALGTHQVHKNVVLRANDENAGRGINPAFSEMDDCDGLFLDDNTTKIDTLCIKTADCVPVLLSSKNGKQVCAVHAGWRGTVSDIVTRAAEMFSCDKNDIICAIGPCINVCCYEVGQEVYDAVKELFYRKGIENLVDNMFLEASTCSAIVKRKANLARINKELLVNYGIPEKNIDVSEICTCCNQDEFFSHRASGGFSGTFLSAIKRL